MPAEAPLVLADYRKARERVAPPTPLGIVAIGDTHFGARGDHPSMPIEAFQRACSQSRRDSHTQLVLWNGDMIDSKAPIDEQERAIQVLVSEAKAYHERGIQVVYTVGNNEDRIDPSLHLTERLQAKGVEARVLRSGWERVCLADGREIAVVVASRIVTPEGQRRVMKHKFYADQIVDNRQQVNEAYLEQFRHDLDEATQAGLDIVIVHHAPEFLEAYDARYSECEGVTKVDAQAKFEPLIAAHQKRYHNIREGYYAHTEAGPKEIERAGVHWTNTCSNIQNNRFYSDLDSRYTNRQAA